MNGKIADSEKPWRKREPIYPEKLVRILETVWEDGQYPWSVRLKELVAMSAATIDRRLAPYKRHASRKIYGKTKPGQWLRRRPKRPSKRCAWTYPSSRPGIFRVVMLN